MLNMTLKKFNYNFVFHILIKNNVFTFITVLKLKVMTICFYLNNIQIVLLNIFYCLNTNYKALTYFINY